MEKQWEKIEAKCIVCGKLELIQPTNKYYKKVKFMPDVPFICVACSGLLEKKSQRKQ